MARFSEMTLLNHGVQVACGTSQAIFVRQPSHVGSMVVGRETLQPKRLSPGLDARIVNGFHKGLQRRLRLVQVMQEYSSQFIRLRRQMKEPSSSSAYWRGETWKLFRRCEGLKALMAEHVE